jgi:hypothetical protein
MHQSAGRKRMKSDFFFFLSSRERLSDRLLMVVRFLFTPSYRDMMAIRLPSSLLGLHRLIRPFRALWRNLRPDTIK